MERFILDEIFFNYLTELEVMRALRYQNYVTLLLLETDRAYTEEGNLKELAEIVRKEIRITDIIGRIDRSRFGVILLHANLNNALSTSERIIGRAKDYFHVHSNGVAISIGGACCPSHGTDTETLTSRAETMLAQARAQGGNTVSFPIGKEEL